MGADVQRHDDGVFCKLEAARPFAASGIIASVAAHEVLQTATMARHGRLA
jgi:2-C-methyl-D-erythritol 4-phosphate cytidylyltransferase